MTLTPPTLHGFKIAVATTTATTLVTPAGGKKFQIVSLFFVCSGAVGVKFVSKPAGAGTDLTGVMMFPQYGGLTPPADAWTPMLIGNAADDVLQIVCDSNVGVNGAGVYIEV